MAERRLLLVAAASLLLCPAAHGQGFIVSGRILDAVTHSPVAHAAVTLVPLDEAAGAEPLDEGPRWGRRGPGYSRPAPKGLHSLTTGGDGRFRFPLVPAGRYQLAAARRGYTTARLDQHGDFYAAVVAGDQAAATGIDFYLSPYATIEGTVQDSSGDPVEYGSVTLFRQATDGSGVVRQARSAALTTGQSSYVFSSLEPGSYFLAVSGRPWFAQGTDDASPLTNPLDMAYPTVFYPDADSSSGAQPVTVAPGDDAHADVTMQAVPAVHLQIDNAAPDSYQLPRLTEEAFGAPMALTLQSAYAQVSRSGGSTSISVAPGSYALEFAGRQTTITANADAKVESSTLASGAAVALTGQLAMSDGKPVPAGLKLDLTQVRTETPRGSRSVLPDFPGEDSGFHPRFFTRPIALPINAAGQFRGAIQPGNYTLGLTDGGLSNPVLITGAAASGASLSNDRSLHVEDAPVMLAATIAVADSSIAGRVVNASGAPEAGVLVLVLPVDQDAAALDRDDESNTDGSWAIDGIPAGNYRILAIRDGWDLAWRQPQALARYLAGAVTVKVSAGSPLTVPHAVTVQPR